MSLVSWARKTLGLDKPTVPPKPEPPSPEPPVREALRVAPDDWHTVPVPVQTRTCGTCGHARKLHSCYRPVCLADAACACPGIA